MKIKIGILMIFIFMSTVFTGCKVLDALLPKDYNDEISLENTKGRYVFQVNYDPQYVRQVYLDNVRIRPGVKYYVKEGKYWFRYIEEEKYTISLLFSRNSFDDEDHGSSNYLNDYETVRRVIMNEDKVINIQGRKCKVNFEIGTSWN